LRTYNPLDKPLTKSGLSLDPPAPRLLSEKELREQEGPFWTSWLNRRMSLTVFSDPVLYAVNNPVHVAIESC